MGRGWEKDGRGWEKDAPLADILSSCAFWPCQDWVLDVATPTIHRPVEPSVSSIYVTHSGKRTCIFAFAN